MYVPPVSGVGGRGEGWGKPARHPQELGGEGFTAARCWLVGGDTVVSAAAVPGMSPVSNLRTDGRRLLSCCCIFSTPSKSLK